MKTQPRHILLPAALILTATLATTACRNTGAYKKPLADAYCAKVLVAGLENPWAMAWGPDNFLWVTERTGKRVTRVDPETGKTRLVGKVDDAWPDLGQEGLLGLALPPKFLDGDNHLYVYYIYRVGGVRHGRIARYTYDPANGTMSDPAAILENLPAGADHNGGRLTFGPDGKLYLSKGELGHNQGATYTLPIEAQRLPTAAEVRGSDWSAYVGKILRINPDGSIPADNPLVNGVRSHVYSYGHRNPQGLAFAGDILFACEHGPSSDDEINRIEAGCNYGWPHVAGFQDDLAYVYANYSAAKHPETLPFDPNIIPGGVPQKKETDWKRPDNYRDPLKTFHTVPNGYDYNDPRYAGRADAYVVWPTIGPSSIAFYPADGAIPWLRGSLLMTTLKNGALYALRLHGNGTQLQGDEQTFFRTQNRYRAIATDPEGRRLFIATDNSGTGRDGEGKPTSTMKNPGAILVFTYQGQK